jgi:hypothetical protein
MISLKDIRAKLVASSSTTNKTFTDNLYRFWDMPAGSTTRVRFLPDTDQSNSFFWVEQRAITLQFRGTKQNPTTPVQVRIPVTNEVMAYNRELWLVDEALGRKFYPKRTYIMQAFVVQDAMNTFNDTQVVRLNISEQVMKNIKSGLLDPSMETNPTDFVNGLDFKIVKSQQGQFANYSTSAYVRKDTALRPDQVETATAIQHLTTLLDDMSKVNPDHALMALDLAVNNQLFDNALNTLTVFKSSTK